MPSGSRLPLHPWPGKTEREKDQEIQVSETWAAGKRAVCVAPWSLCAAVSPLPGHPRSSTERPRPSLPA